MGASSPNRFDWRTSARIHGAQQARARWPDRFESLTPALGRGDPLADALVARMARAQPSRSSLIDQAVGRAPLTPDAPAEARAFRDSLATPDFAVPARLARAAEAFFATGMAGGLSLGVRSLVRGYAAPAGNKPLVLSGQLETRAARRIGETAAFVHAVYQPGALLGSDAVAICGRVRLMHARVRHLCLQDTRWRLHEWGLPINQHDMLATVLLFSSVWMDGTEQIGVPLDQGGREDIVHLWRVVGHYLGVEPELLPTSHAEAVEAQTFIHATQGPPDDDSRALVSAYLNAGEAETALRGVARMRRRLAGWLIAELNPDIAPGLRSALGEAPRRLAITTLARGVSPAVALRKRLRPELGPRNGRAYWARVLDQSPGASAPRFDLPLALRRA